MQTPKTTDTDKHKNTETYPRYPAYKDSGVDWIGEVPVHWELKRMKRIFKDVSEKNRPEAELLSVTQSQGVVPRSWVETRMVMPSGNLESFKFIREGEFAISLRSFEGGLEYCHHDGIISPAYTVLRQIIELEPLYYKYLFKSAAFISELQTSVVGIREGKNISYPELSYSFLPIPPRPEQTKIAAFLDQKTTQIDRAIAQKERLIELLRERRQVLIHRAVTKGLNPEVEMRDSGVDWIGEIPAHWEVKRLRYFIKDLESGVSVNASESESASEEEIGVLNTSCVYKYRFESDKNKKVFKEELGRVKCPVRGNTIIISRMNAPDLVGASGFVPRDFPNLFLPDRLWQTVFFPGCPVNVEWLSKVLASIRFRGYISSIATGSSPSMKNISKGDLLDSKIVFPPIKEQDEILKFINSLSKKNQAINEYVKNEIKLLKELKSTLINAAVTGKIKV